ncbi:MAG: class I tRNA ligase family protein [Thalassobaculum sp.]
MKSAKTADAVAAAMESYRFNDAAAALYQFFWGTFCDWYLEFTKPILQTPEGGPEHPSAAETRATTAWALNRALHLLHPIMPYITEELWASFGEEGDQLLVSRPWPALAGDLIDAKASAEMDWVVRLISEVRSIRAEMNVPPSAQNSAVAGRRRYRDRSPGGDASRPDHPSCAPLVDRDGWRGSGRRGSGRAGRGDPGPADRRRDRHRPGTGPALEGDRQG